MSESSVQLGYAKRPRWHGRKWLARIVILLMALVSTGTAAWLWGPEKWERAELLYWEWRCMHYSASPNEVVFDQEPGRKSTLIDGRAGYTASGDAFVSPRTMAAAKIPPGCMNEFLSQMQAPPRGAREPILFMHARTAPSGRKYLIILRGASIEEAWEEIGQIFVCSESYTVGDFHNWPEPATPGWGRNGFLPDTPVPKRLRIYAGQADPADESHFSVRYQEDGQSHIIDGFVYDIPDPSWGLTNTDHRLARVTLSECRLR